MLNQYLTDTYQYIINVIVCKVVSPPPFQNHHPPITSIPPTPPFRKIPHHPTLPANQSSQVLLIDRNATVKLSSINTIHSFSSAL